MLAYIVGQVDINSAAVLVSFFAMLTIVGAIWFAKRRSRVEIDNDFELAKIRQSNENNLAQANLKKAQDETHFKLETDRLVKMGQVEQGLITSHARAGTDNPNKNENPKMFQADE